MTEWINRVFNKSCESMEEIPDRSVHCVVTSPPYYGLRDYGTGRWEGGSSDCDHSRKTSSKIASSTLASRGLNLNHEREPWKGGVCGKCGARKIDEQIGLEATPTEYINRLVSVFREVRRILRDDGTVWVNIGDSYFGDSPVRTSSAGAFSASWDPTQTRSRGGKRRSAASVDGMKTKDLMGIPWMLAFALRGSTVLACSTIREWADALAVACANNDWDAVVAIEARMRLYDFTGALEADGWYLRSDIVWSKKNPMPDPAEDRPTRSHEFLFLLTKSKHYYYDADAIREPLSEASVARLESGAPLMGGTKGGGEFGASSRMKSGNAWNPDVLRGANRRTVWTIATATYPDAHFAVMPRELAEPCVLAGCPAFVCAHCGDPYKRITEADHTIGYEPVCSCKQLAAPGIAFDMFMGAGTVAEVALHNGRRFGGYELSPEFCGLIRDRLGLFGEGVA